MKKRIIDIYFEVSEALLPPWEVKEKFDPEPRKVIDRLTHVIVGMIIGSSMTTDQIKAVMEELQKSTKK